MGHDHTPPPTVAGLAARVAALEAILAAIFDPDAPAPAPATYPDGRAIGDGAAAAGMLLVAGTDDRRNGWVEINRSRDYIAALETELRAWVTAGFAPKTHTHTGEQIVSGTVATARLAADTSFTPNTLVLRTSAGNVSIATPTAPTHGAHKQYVDDSTRARLAEVLPVLAELEARVAELEAGAD